MCLVYRRALRKHKLPADCPWTMEQMEDNAMLAVESMCDLLVTKPFFNFSTNLLNALVPCMGLPPRTTVRPKATGMRTL